MWQRSQEIAGVRDAHVREYPYMAAVSYGLNGTSGYKCGGTLISENYVMSAVHCAKPSNQYQPTTVLLGDVRLGQDQASGDRLVNIKRIIFHPERELDSKYVDIVLIEIDKPIEITKAIYPACIPQPEDRLENFLKSTTLTTAGWGLTDAFAGVRSDVPQKVGLNRLFHTDCEKIFNLTANERNIIFPKGIFRSDFCAADPPGDKGNKDNCNGDIGGGLFVKKREEDCTAYIIGVTSFKSRDCGAGEPSVYTNVQSYLDWIEFTVWPGL